VTTTALLATLEVWSCVIKKFFVDVPVQVAKTPPMVAEHEVDVTDISVGIVRTILPFGEAGNV